MALQVSNIESRIIHRLANGDIHQFLMYWEDGDEDGGLRRTVCIIQLIGCRRIETGQFLTTTSEM